MGIAKRSLLAAATIAGASAIALGAGAGTANARYLGRCAGTAIRGQGATLQNSAQSLWISGFGSICPGIGVSYTGTGSGAGLNSWGADGGTGTPAASGYAYIASDDAPNATQIANIRAAANNANVVVLPVAQAAIAIIANPPAGCTVSQISNAVLEQAYRGVARTWADLPGASGTCSSAISPVVRQDASGTTYQFKQYLFRINTAAVYPSGSPTLTWQDLQTIDARRPTSNQTWPGSPVTATATGGSGVIATVAAATGRIGYVNVADWQRSNRATSILNVQNRSAVPQTYVSPISSGNANCAAATYAGIPSPSGSRYVNLDWSRVYGVNPNIGGSTYPICILTYGVKLAGNGSDRTTDTSGYQTAGFSSPDAVATSVFDYADYQLGRGQSDILGNGYAPLPTGTGSVADAAARAHNEIW
jgi:ABC-type phosphate transport system substrate-binding protein